MSSLHASCSPDRLPPRPLASPTPLSLPRYVYERLTPPNGKPTFFTLVATQIVSGLWHGLYPGESAAAVVAFAGGCRRPFAAPSKLLCRPKINLFILHRMVSQT